MEIISNTLEQTLFSLIGWGLLSIPAFLVAAFVIGFVLQTISKPVWGFIDEGDTKLPDLVGDLSRKLFSVLKITSTVVSGKAGSSGEEKFFVEDEDGLYSHKNYQVYGRNTIWHEGYDTKEEAEARLIKDSTLAVNWVFLLIASFIPIGLGLLCLPTVTLFVAATLLSLLALRWSRRGIKRSKKVSEMLEAHVNDVKLHTGEK